MKYNLNVSLRKLGIQIVTNLKSLIFAFVVAIIIWVAISFQMFPNITGRIELEIIAEPTPYMRDLHLVLADEFSETEHFTIEGKRYDVSALNSEHFYAYLDFSDVRGAGVYEVDVVVRARSDANAAFLVQNEKQKRTVKIIQVAEKALRIVPETGHLEVEEGLTIEHAGVTVNPDTITISGEKSLIDSIAFAQVRAIGSYPLARADTLSGELAFLDENGLPVYHEGVSFENRAFTVDVPVFKRGTLPLEVGISAPDNFNIEELRNKIRIDPDELTIASPDTSIDSLNSLSLGTVSLSEITFGNLESGLPIQIALPDGYANISGNTTARLTFDEIEGYGARQFDVSTNNVRVANVPSGYVVNFVTRVIRVRVVGPSDVIHAMTADDIVGTINFAGVTDISAGAREIGVKFMVDGTNVSAWVSGEYKVNIDIVSAP